MELKYVKPLKMWFPPNVLRPQKCIDGLKKYENDWLYPFSLIESPETKLCVQAGGHLGYWPLMLAKKFAHVVTFEPEPYAYAALAKNIGKLKREPA